jgi:hypothetical protein
MTDSIEEAWQEFLAHLRNALDDARRGSHGSQPWPEDRAKALALAVHEAGCLDCRIRYQDRNETAWQDCMIRQRIQALGAKP